MSIATPPMISPGTKAPIFSTQSTLAKLDDIWTSILDGFGRAWWVEVSTAQPSFTYYFGPFAAAKLAESAASGYIEDLQGESAQDIRSTIKRCKPDQLTIELENIKN
jgi:Domain of unknown function (DUF1816)